MVTLQVSILWIIYLFYLLQIHELWMTIWSAVNVFLGWIRFWIIISRVRRIFSDLVWLTLAVEFVMLEHL